MSKKYTIQYDADRINPEFVGINQKYSKKKKQRREIQQKKHSLQNSLNKIEKTNEELELSLNKKKHQLKYLKNVRERYMNDLKHKAEQNERNNFKLEQLKTKTYRARNQHRNNLCQAIQSKFRQNHQAGSEVRQQINEIKRSKVENKQKMSQFYEKKWQQLSEQKQLSKSKINRFYRKKNKLLLTSYRNMIQDEQLKSNKSVQQIDFLQTRTSNINNKVNKKQKKLKSIEDEIEKYKISSLQLKNMEYNGVSIFNSRISGLSKLTQKSSRPADILLSATQQIKHRDISMDGHRGRVIASNKAYKIRNQKHGNMVQQLEIKRETNHKKDEAQSASIDDSINLVTSKDEENSKLLEYKQSQQ